MKNKEDEKYIKELLDIFEKLSRKEVDVRLRGIEAKCELNLRGLAKAMGYKRQLKDKSGAWVKIEK